MDSSSGVELPPAALSEATNCFFDPFFCGLSVALFFVPDEVPGLSLTPSWVMYFFMVPGLALTLGGIPEVPLPALPLISSYFLTGGFSAVQFTINRDRLYIQ